MRDFSDVDILNYLMISEFNEGLSPEEFKFLLYKFRYYYRLTYGKNETMKAEIEKLKSDILDKDNINKINLNNLNSEKAALEEKYNQLLNKKLTWKERIKGKIILKENEINGI